MNHYQRIPIESIMERAKKMWKCDNPSGFEPRAGLYLGGCGYSQSCIYYAARVHGVSPECIKICQGADIVENIRHVFVLLILDQIYLCDLSFSQFICEEADIEKAPPAYRKEIMNLYRKGYTVVTEPVLISFYTFCHRRCESKPYSPEWADIHLMPTGEYSHNKNINFLQITIDREWPTEPDHDTDEFLCIGCITEEEKKQI